LLNICADVTRRRQSRQRRSKTPTVLAQKLARHIVGETMGHDGLPVIMDILGQRIHRPAKVAMWMQAYTIRHELTDVHIVWVSEGQLTLVGFERYRNTNGKPVHYAKRWLCNFDFDPVPTSNRRSNVMSNRKSSQVHPLRPREEKRTPPKATTRVNHPLNSLATILCSVTYTAPPSRKKSSMDGFYYKYSTHTSATRVYIFNFYVADIADC
jgi:hypothetical protein